MALLIWQDMESRVENLPSSSYRISLLVLVLLFSPRLAAAVSNLRPPSQVIPPGETLVYEIRWDPPAWMFFLPTISAGELTVQFKHQAVLDGKPVHQITAHALSSGFFPKLTGVTVDDTFESFVQADRFCSLKMTKRLREGKRHRDVFLTFDGERGTGRYRAYDAAKAPPAELKNEEVKNVPPCVQDILSGIYVARLQELRPGGRFPLTVGDDGTIKQVEVRVINKESVDAIAGQFSAWKLESVSVFGALFKGGGTFVVWFSNDARQMPVKFEARVKLGKVFGTLKEIRK